MRRPADKTRNGGGTRDDRGGREHAEALAIAALSFLASDAERLGPFLALSGLGPESLRSAATEPHFLAGVLDYLVSDEKLLLDFAAHETIDPFDVTRARRTLRGPEEDGA